MKVRFWTSDKPRERILSEAIGQGVMKHGDEYDTRALGNEATPDCDVAIMVGVKSKELWQAHLRLGCQMVYLDKGYSRHDRGDGSRVWEYWRVSVNAHHPTAKFRVGDYPDDRSTAAGWTFEKWKPNASGPIIIAGSSEKYHSFYDLKPPTEWAQKLVKEIRRTTQNPIIYRPKASWKGAVPIDGTTFKQDGSIDDVLKGAWCLVTHGSNACFEAMLAGVPSIILGEAVMRPISSTEISEIHSMKLATSKERASILAFLAYHQWTMEEMASGKMWEVVRKEIFR
jgi:hypothetical protein